jgi:hypothetical protein
MEILHASLLWLARWSNPLETKSDVSGNSTNVPDAARELADTTRWNSVGFLDQVQHFGFKDDGPTIFQL